VLEARWYCPACEVVTDDPGADGDGDDGDDVVHV
jgi:hypothetical protein